MKEMLFIVSALFSLLTFPVFSAEASGHVKLSFAFNRQAGMSTNQFVVWVENESREIVRTIFITSFVTAKGGWQIRDDNLMVWHERSRVDRMPREEMDAFTGATPSASQILDFAWDCRDSTNNRIHQGTYYLMIEGSMSSQSHVLFEIPITIGQFAVRSEGKPKYFGEKPVGHNMLEDVIVTYQP